MTHRLFGYKILKSATFVLLGTGLGLLLLSVSHMGFSLLGTQALAKKQVPQSQAEVQRSFAPVVKKAAPAVVNVYVRHQTVRRRSRMMDDPLFRYFFGRGGLAMPRRRLENSLGSGVIVAPEGIIVTNHHVIAGSGITDIKVALPDRREFSARVMLRDKKTDLAVLKIDAKGEVFPFLEFEDSDRAEVGDLVLAIGNPFGVGQTVTSGIISALSRTRIGKSDHQSFLQTDAAINPGNSGGALVDMNGRLLGINTAIFSKSGGSHGIGFAIPSNLARVVLTSAQQGGKEVRRPWFGAKLQRVTSDIAASLGLRRTSGALVRQVVRGSPAQKAGLRSGDVIISVDGHDVADQRGVQYRLTTRGIGGKATMGIVRDGDTLDVSVRLRSAPEVPPRRALFLTGNHPFEGAQVGNLSPALAEELALSSYKGVVVMVAPRGSSAHSIGLRKGDVLLNINGEDVKSTSHLRSLLRYPLRAWRFSIRRKGKVLSTIISG